MTTGKINVSVENIFPLIKKFLYSDHEIFLRELVSNGTDATLKLKHLTSIGEAKVEYGNPMIENMPATSAPTDSIMFATALSVPPVAIRSSMISHLLPGRRSSL